MHFGDVFIEDNTVYLQAYAESATPSVRENVCNDSKKRKKSCFFWILKKNVKNVKKRTYSFTGHNYRKPVPVSHQHQTSCSEMRTQESMQLRNV